MSLKKTVVFDHAVQAGSGFFQNGPDIFQGLACLARDIRGHFPGVRRNGQLSRREHELGSFHGLRVRADGTRSLIGFHLGGHVISLVLQVKFRYNDFLLSWRLVVNKKLLIIIKLFITFFFLINFLGQFLEYLAKKRPRIENTKKAHRDSGQFRPTSQTNRHVMAPPFLFKRPPVARNSA